MNLTLKRTQVDATGAFGVLLDDMQNMVCFTLERAYPQDDKSFAPKVPVGVYQCKRGVHCLADGVKFETFEVTGVPDHTGILFHCGNDENDSSGCILVALQKVGSLILKSRDAFQKLMTAQLGLDTFQLTVK